MFEEQKRITLKTHALIQIKKAIQSGWLKPGDRIIEADLAKKMKISRFPIREALSFLEKEGFVITIPFKGTYISKFNEKDLEEIYTLRSALEELAIRILMNESNKDFVSELESILKAMERAAHTRNVGDLISEDLHFHRTICELSNHKRLVDMWMTLEDQLTVFLTLEERLRESSYKLVETHYPILDAIKKGDGQLAEKNIRNHFTEALNLLKGSGSNRMGRARE